MTLPIFSCSSKKSRYMSYFSINIHLLITLESWVSNLQHYFFSVKRISKKKPKRRRRRWNLPCLGLRTLEVNLFLCLNTNDMTVLLQCRYSLLQNPFSTHNLMFRNIYSGRCSRRCYRSCCGLLYSTPKTCQTLSVLTAWVATRVFSEVRCRVTLTARRRKGRGESVLCCP